MTRLRVGLIFLVLILTGCPSTSDRSIDNSLSEIVIGAAASLKDVISQIKPIYEAQYPQQSLTITFASSGTIQRQITQGAPIDIFISADRSKVDTLASQNLLINSTIQNLVQNQIVLVSGNSSLGVNSFTDLAKNQVQTVAMGEPKTVPGGKYAQEVLDYYNIELPEKTVYGKDIRQVLNYVVTQNTDVGLVYLTDALSRSEELNIIATAPLEAHSPINYAIAVTQASQNPELADNLLNFLLSEPAQDSFKQAGFLVLSDNNQTQ